MITRKLIAICLIISISALTINIISFDTIELEKSVAESDHEQTKPEIQWNRTYGGNRQDIAEALIQTSNGGFVLAGVTASYIAEGTHSNMWLVKTDANGVAEWNQTFGGVMRDRARALIQTSEGDFVLAGHTNSYGAGYDDMWLVKTDTNGVVLWNQTYGGIGPDVAWALIQTTDGGLALAGYTMPRVASYFDMWLIKTDAKGVALWNQTYGGKGSYELTHDGANALIQTKDGGFALAGYTRLLAWSVKTDANGIALWNQTYGRGYFTALIQISNGGFLLAGTTNAYSEDNDDMWLVKTDANGVALWNQTYGGTEDEGANALIQTKDSGFALAGYTSSYGAGNYDMWLVKTDANGIAQWNQTYGGSKSDWGKALLQTTDGDFILAGLICSFGEGSSDMWLVKTGSTSETTTGLEILPLLAAVIVLISCYKRKNKKS